MSIRLIISILFGSVFAFIWLRKQYGNHLARNTSQSLISGLDTGKLSFEKIASELGMTIRNRKLPAGLNARELSARILKMKSSGTGDIKIPDARSKDDQHVIIIAEASVSDIIATPSSTGEVELIYPCWLYIYIDNNDGSIIIRSEMPADKDHQYRLEELADHVYNTAIA